MKVLKTIFPGDKGSQLYLKEWGKQLLTVRYRYDPVRDVNLTTLEIVVDERPKIKKSQQQCGYLSVRNKTTVAVIIKYSEIALREKVKAHGGRWDKNRQMWLMPYKRAVTLGLKERIHQITANE